ncbi:MAG: M23 family peptidase, partial [Variovorax sp.]
VSRGQPIAEMGQTGTDRVKLRFEIRKAGVAVDPEPYLSGRMQ